MLKYGLHVYSVKGANMRDQSDTTNWFIRFDDAHSIFNDLFVTNLRKMSESL